MRRLVLVGFVVALAWPAAAFAHATLKSEQPGFRQRFERAPAQVVLRFDQGVYPLPKSIVV
jgi:methionine-rich copper-binding protein CopC